MNQGLKNTLVGLLAPFVMLFLVFRIKWDSEPTWATSQGAANPFDPSFVVRGDLPEKYRDWQTMDCRFPGGMYEAAIRGYVGGGAWWRRLWASWVWAGWRNRAHGYAYRHGHQTTDYIPDPFSTDRDRTGWTREGNVWTFTRGDDAQSWRLLWGKTFLITGMQVYALRDGRFWAVPVFTLKRFPAAAI